MVDADPGTVWQRRVHSRARGRRRLRSRTGHSEEGTLHRKLAFWTLGIAAGLTLLLGAEVVYAILAERLPPRKPHDLDGRVGGSGAPLRMAWIGDSVAAGVGASGPDAALPRVVAQALGRPVELDVVAFSGARVSGALDDQVPLVEALDPPPDVIVVVIGANDVIHLAGGRRFRRDYDRLLAHVNAVGARHVICLGLPSFSSTPRFLQPLRTIIAWRARVLDAEVRTSAAEHEAHYVDIASATEPAFDANPEGTHAADDFHPNDAGYRAWARAVLSVLRPLVAS